MTAGVHCLSYLVFLLAGTLLVDSADKCPYQGCVCERNIIDCRDKRWTSLPALQSTTAGAFVYLHLENNPINSITTGSLPSGLTEINMINVSLSQMDDNALLTVSSTLKSLIFTHARFTKIPDALLHVKALTNLVIEETPISAWDDKMMKYIGTTLSSLNLENVRISGWPAWMADFAKLSNLDMTSTFPLVPNGAITKHKGNMQFLTLVNGSLTEVPHDLPDFTKLKVLTLDNNQIVKIPGLPSHGSLTYLSLNNNKISDVAQLTQALHQVADSLLDFHMESNHLASFPDMSFMTLLQTVYLGENLIDNTSSGSVPHSVYFLQLSGNRISSVPEFLVKATGLQTVNLDKNDITTVVAHLPASLVNLDLSSNKISHLLDNSFSFPSGSGLDVLHLDFNPLESISQKAFAPLTQLVDLNMQGTKLTRLPLGLTSINTLSLLDMSQNKELVCTCNEKSLRPWALKVNLDALGNCGVTSIEDFVITLSASCPN